MEDKEVSNQSVAPATQKLLSKVSDVDHMAIQLMKTRRQLAVANAKTALSEQEKVELQYNMMVMNLFSKYNLTSQDRIEEDGTIIREK